MNGIILYEMWPYFTQIRFVPLRLSTWFIMYKEHKFSDISFIYVAKQNSSRWSWHCWDKDLMTTTMMMVVMIHLFVLCSSLQGANSYWSKISPNPIQESVHFEPFFYFSHSSISWNSFIHLCLVKHWQIFSVMWPTSHVLFKAIFLSFHSISVGSMLVGEVGLGLHE